MMTQKKINTVRTLPDLSDGNLLPMIADLHSIGVDCFFYAYPFQNIFHTTGTVIMVITCNDVIMILLLMILFIDLFLTLEQSGVSTNTEFYDDEQNLDFLTSVLLFINCIFVFVN